MLSKLYTYKQKFRAVKMPCYLALELISGLKQSQPDELNYSKESDVYAFAAVWYEISSGEFPFKGQARLSTKLADYETNIGQFTSNVRS